MTVAEPLFVRWGPPHAQDPALDASWPDLAPDRRPGDWPALLDRLAALDAGRVVLLLGAGVELSAPARDLLQAAAGTVGSGLLGALDNLDPALSPLPPGLSLPAPLPVADLARLCAWLGRGTRVPVQTPPLAACLWWPGAAARLRQAEWRPGQPVPDDLPCLALAGAFVADPQRALEGPERWPDKLVPPPVSWLDLMRDRWPTRRQRGSERGTDRGRIAVAEAPPGPVPGLDRVPVVLHICHGWGGGSQRFINDLAAADPDRCHLQLTAYGDTPRHQFGELLDLHPVGAPRLQLARFPLLPPIADTGLGHAVYRQVLAEVIARWQVTAVMVSSVIGHDLAALTTGLPTLVVGHDYYPLWPELHQDFGDRSQPFDQAALARLLATGPVTLFADRSAQAWWRLRDGYVAALKATRPVLAVPTAQVRDNMLAMAPELAGLDWQVLPHGIEPWPEPSPAGPAPPKPRKRLRVLVAGRIGGGKGLALLPALLDELAGACEFVFVGAGDQATALFGRPGVHLIADYRREQLPALVAGLQPDLALLPATVAETFGYLLSELQSLGLPVLATAIGSYAERIRDGVDGLLAPPQASVLARRLRQLAGEPELLATIRANLRQQPARDTAAMAADYRRLLPVPVPRALDLDGPQPDWRETQLAQVRRHLDESRHHRDLLHAMLAKQEQELARRAAWGFALDRQIRELSHRDGAREQQEQAQLQELLQLRELLQQRVQQLQLRADELDRVYRSLSWRLTGPFRRLARLLRGRAGRLTFQRKRLAAFLRRARLSLATRGLVGSLRHARQRRWRLPGPFAAPINVLVPTNLSPPARLPTSEQPEVSIVIPAYGKLAFTNACLRSLAEHAGATPFEVIVVDDASPDDSAQALAGVGGLRLLRNAANLGFVGSCNAGAAAARGRWLVFLNNDTQVTAGWLEALLATLEAFPDAGLVGARLVYPDGRLQEAGGLVFSDGSGWNYGRFEDAADPAYGYTRVTDYCSGAAILIERALFDRLGGFDERYAPAYYEDTDLAFKVREAGLQVVCQPAATVIHFEGTTAGTDLGAGMKRYQVVNQAKFQDRWREALARQPAPGGDVAAIVRAAPRGRVLVVDATTPEPDQDSGSVRLTHLLTLLRRSGRHVSFMADNRAWVPGYTERLQRLGIEVLYHPWVDDPVDWLRRHGPALDAVIVSRHYIAGHYLDLVRRHAPRARFVFDTVDLHYLREQRTAEVTGSDEIARQAARTRVQELRLVRAADVTLVVSSAERDLLAVAAPGARVDVLSNVHPVVGCRRGFAERADLFFVGGFQHPPNGDAVTWFIREVFPRVRAQAPGIRFHVVGSRMPAAIAGLAGGGVEIHGHVADLEPFLDGCRIALAPLRYGAGVKGKINMSMSYGQPVVATPVAVEGMHLDADQQVLVADGAEAFADAVLRLYHDPDLWQRLSAGGLDNVRRHFSFEAAGKALERALADRPDDNGRGTGRRPG